MKKYSWIVALLLALSLAFFACDNGSKGGDDDDDDDDVVMENKVVFDMATDAGIQALTEGKLTIGNSLPKGADSPIKPLQEAGEGDNHVIITAVKGPGEQKIALQYEATASWGAGIDLPFKAFGFRVGDKITITGEVLAIGTSVSYIQPNFKVGGENGHGFKVTEDGPFTWDIVLDDSMLSDIKGGDPSAIRIDGRAGTSGNVVPTGQKVVINNIHIEGMRPTTITKLAAPVIALTGSTVAWTAVEGSSGYDVYSGTEKKTSIKGVSIDIATADEFAYDTKHTITVVALGTAGSTSDSDASNAVEYTKPAKQIIGFNVTVGAATQKVEVDGVKGTVTLLANDAGYTFKNLVTGSNDNYGNAYATFAVDLGAGKTLADVTTITCKFKGIAGDIGYKTDGVRLNVGEEPFTGYQTVTNKFANDESISDDGKSESTFTFTIKTTATDVTDLTAQKLYFVIYIHGNAKGNEPDATQYPGDGLPTEYSIYDVAFTFN
jgi:hypothetical protein